MCYLVIGRKDDKINRLNDLIKRLMDEYTSENLRDSLNVCYRREKKMINSL